MKKAIFFTVLLFTSFFVNAQSYPKIKIDSDTVVLNSGLAFPYWLNSGQLIKMINNIKTISIVEFTKDSIEGLKLSSVFSLSSTNSQTVPQGKIWKMESIGTVEGVLSNYLGQTKSTDTVIQATNGFSNLTQPSIFISPKTFNSPGNYQWKVPPNVNKICVELWGGGGNSGNRGNPSGGGGGGGAYGYECLNVIPLSDINITVGGSGGGTSSTSNGTKVIYATGGFNGSDATTAGGTGGDGGVSNANFNISGKSGYNGSDGGMGGNSGNIGIGGFTSNSGASCDNIDGTSPGGGGGAINTGINICSQKNATYHGQGGNGQVIIYW